ncbi:MAG: type II toxin-antitoxin system ParD family antitoxin [Nitrospira sp.]|nr:type II toxin-antitoxin system ParD family antitoxin [Nitrospira sp.]MDE0404585.1 type II toxin-antitoxin system ParD family antitoxin [Nitrospira sp.]MDE0486819.1 type II toxin-antitoxin system ParD family antitoxin [Nitrospira sp.]
MPRRTISITDTHDDWLKTQVASGQYRSESEVISDLIRERQQRDAGIEAIRLAMAEDDKCGPGTPTPADVRTAIQERLRKNG